MAIALKLLSRYRRSVVAVVICGAVAFLAAVVSVYAISLSPPGLQPRKLQIAAAAVHVKIDDPQPEMLDRRAALHDFDALTARTVLLGDLITSDPVLPYVGRRAGVDPSLIAASMPITANVVAVLREPDSERRANDILESKKRYRLNIQPSPTLPILNIYAQAPTPQEAERLADAAVTGLQDYMRATAIKIGVDPTPQAQFEQLGRARGAVINSSAKKEIAGFTFLSVFGVLVGLIAFLSRVRRGWRWAARREQADPEEHDVASASEAARATTSDPRAAATRIVSAAGDWPRTTRVLPWMLALFMAVIWLTPFNTIQLSASLPIDLKLDRLILPFIAVAWVLVFAARGRFAPRVRLTWIHGAIALYVAVVCLSLVIDARYLNQTLEFDMGVKKLTLLASYLSLFLMVSSVIRRTEVRAFLTYTLVLAVICAVGTIWEYRFKYNIFYVWTGELLPPIFKSAAAQSAGVDEIGRPIISGPAEVSLECVAMLAMALPIALVRLMDSTERRQRILYGLAVCLLMAAAISTYRKSAFIAPIAVVMTLAYFRRRELLRLSPLALVLFVAVHILSPGAFGSIAFQLHSNRLDAVTTVSDRTSDYDAVRPDVWSHLAFGRGFGTYDHFSYRILDMQLLGLLVEVGVIGLAAYILMGISVIALARRPIKRRDSTSQVGLVAAASAVAFLVVSALFDVMSFPHCPYIFLWIAGLLTVVVNAPPDPPAIEAVHEPPAAVPVAPDPDDWLAEFEWEAPAAEPVAAPVAAPAAFASWTEPPRDLDAPRR